MIELDGDMSALTSQFSLLDKGQAADSLN